MLKDIIATAEAFSAGHDRGDLATGFSLHNDHDRANIAWLQTTRFKIFVAGSDRYEAARNSGIRHIWCTSCLMIGLIHQLDFNALHKAMSTRQVSWSLNDGWKQYPGVLDGVNDTQQCSSCCDWSWTDVQVLEHYPPCPPYPAWLGALPDEGVMVSWMDKNGVPSMFCSSDKMVTTLPSTPSKSSKAVNRTIPPLLTILRRHSRLSRRSLWKPRCSSPKTILGRVWQRRLL